MLLRRVDLAQAGDLKGFRALEINPVSSSPKLLKRSSATKPPVNGSEMLPRRVSLRGRGTALFGMAFTLQIHPFGTVSMSHS